MEKYTLHVLNKRKQEQPSYQTEQILYKNKIRETENFHYNKVVSTTIRYNKSTSLCSQENIVKTYKAKIEGTLGEISIITA